MTVCENEKKCWSGLDRAPVGALSDSRSGLRLTSDDTAHYELQFSAPSSRRRITMGQLVRSLAGRDLGHIYMVIRCEGDSFVWLADGRKRLLATPKRKNTLHLQPFNRIAADLIEHLETSTATDEQVRAAIKAMLIRKEGE